MGTILNARLPSTMQAALVIRRYLTPHGAMELAASGGLSPPKSNWARAIKVPPFVCYPLIGAVAYTFGGVATDDRARVMRDGVPIPGLYAAGEMTGHFHATAPNAVSMLRALVFGRIAGREAVASLYSKQDGLR